jgi:NAD(P)-dependent dehydrogenase (short-subunit alcohol dehydrogenase family)
MTQGIKGKVVVITGASGLSEAAARLLAKRRGSRDWLRLNHVKGCLTDGAHLRPGFRVREPHDVRVRSQMHVGV